MKKALSALMLMFSVVAVAQLVYKSEGSVEASFDRDLSPARVRIEVKKGFHINDKAPIRVEIGDEKYLKPQTLEAQRVIVELDSKAIRSRGILRASVFVCDDALTVCEKRVWSWDLQGKPVVGRGVKSDARPEEKPKPASVKKENGFYLDSFEKGQKECARTKKPLLVEFSARWCPGCMRLEKEVWLNPEMQKTLRKFVKVKMDADRFANKPWMEKYGIGGIPATLVLNCEGIEIDRFIDFQPRPVLQQALGLIAKTKHPLTRDQLETRFKAGDAEAALSLALRSALSMKNAQAMEYFAMVPKSESHLEYWWAHIGVLTELQGKTPSDENRKKLQKALDAGVLAFGETPSSLDWRQQLADLQGVRTSAGRETLRSLIQVCDGLIKDEFKMRTFNSAEFAGDYQGIEPLKVYQAKAEALELLEQKDEAKRAWADAVAEGGKLAIKDEPSGPFYRFLAILKKAGEKERVTRFFESSLAKDPESGELNRRYAKFLFDQGQFQQAATRALKSVNASYDQNEIFAAELYAKALKQLGQSKEAREFLLKYEARTDLPQGSRAEITELLTTIK